MNDLILSDIDDGHSFNVWSKGNYHRILAPDELANKGNVLIISPKIDNSKNSIPFEVFKLHILDNLNNSIIYAIVGTIKSVPDEHIRGVRRLYITVHEITNAEEYNKVMNISRRIIVSNFVLSDDFESTIEISSQPSKLYSNSIINYDTYES